MSMQRSFAQGSRRLHFARQSNPECPRQTIRRAPLICFGYGDILALVLQKLKEILPCDEVVIQISAKFIRSQVN